MAINIDGQKVNLFFTYGRGSFKPFQAVFQRLTAVKLFKVSTRVDFAYSHHAWCFGGRKRWFSPIPSLPRNLWLSELLSMTPSGDGGFTSYCTTTEGPCMELEATEQGGEKGRKRNARRGLVLWTTMRPSYRWPICRAADVLPTRDPMEEGRWLVGLERDEV